MEDKVKDCRLIYCDKRIHEFSSKDLAVCLKWISDSKLEDKVYAIETPWCVFQMLFPDQEAFRGYEFIRDAMLDGGNDEGGHSYGED